MRYSFGDCLLDTGSRELRRDGALVPVAPQVFDLLVFLITNRARVVTKDELIESIWQGRIVSDAAVTTRLNVARSAIGDSGEDQRFIKTLPRKGFRFIGSVGVSEQEAAAALPESAVAPRPSLALPDKPSIAVLPFANLSGDPEQEYFADGVVEDIIAGLSRLRWLFVIARNSSFVYKGQNVDIKQVGRELGVRYVLEGSIRRAGNQLRISSQLADTSTGASLYANRFDGTLVDVFELQDRVTESVLTAIAPQVEQAEIVRAQYKTDNLDAYDHYLRGLADFYLLTRDGTERALAAWRRSTDSDPNFALAYARSAMAYFRRRSFGWFTDSRHESVECARLSRLAVQCGGSDAAVLSYAGLAIAYVSAELDEGAASAERALRLNPDLASTQYASGWIKLWLGEPTAAIEHFERAIRLNPLDPLIIIVYTGICHAHFMAGRYDEGAAFAEAGLSDQREWTPLLRMAAASHAAAGRTERASHFMARLLRLFPTLRISGMSAVHGPYRHHEATARIEEALRKAGLPE